MREYSISADPTYRAIVRASLQGDTTATAAAHDYRLERGYRGLERGPSTRVKGGQAALRRWLRQLANAPRHVPIHVVPGDGAPISSGRDGYAEFKGGGSCRNWYSARQAGYKVRYRASTRRVEVGFGWLAARGIDGIV